MGHPAAVPPLYLGLPHRLVKGGLERYSIEVPASRPNAQTGSLDQRAAIHPTRPVPVSPTLIKLCGGPANKQQSHLDGGDIWPTLTEGKPTPHDAILLNTTPSSGAIRMGQWKLIVRTAEDDADGGPARKRSGADRAL